MDRTIINLNKYKIVARGENCLLQVEDHHEKLGFYITSYLKAKNPMEAEHLVVQVLMKELKAYYHLEVGDHDPPRIFVEKIEELESFDGIELPGSGFAFFKPKLK